MRGFYAISLVLAFGLSSLTHAADLVPAYDKDEACGGLEYNPFPEGLVQHLGAWDACEVIAFEPTEF